MLVYTVMNYDYEQTDIVIATHSLAEALKHEGEGILRVWSNGRGLQIHRVADTDTFQTNWKEDVLEEEEKALFELFLKTESKEKGEWKTAYN